ncbi:MAG: hypothetical protein ACRC50_06080 [Gaiella sp.]
MSTPERQTDDDPAKLGGYGGTDLDAPEPDEVEPDEVADDGSGASSPARRRPPDDGFARPDPQRP